MTAGEQAPGRPAVLVLATRNSHKVGELRRILDEAGLAIELLDVAEAEARCGRLIPEVPETGATFEANARTEGRSGGCRERIARGSR